MRAWHTGAVMVAGAWLVTGCQLLSGLGGLHEGSGAGGSSNETSATSTSQASSSAGAGGAGGMGGAASSSSGPDPCGGVCELGACDNGECAPYKLGDIGPREPTTLAVNAKSLFAAVPTGAPSGETPDGEILRIALGKTNGKAVVAATAIAPTDFAVDDSSLYWLDATWDGATYRGLLRGLAIGINSTGANWMALPNLSSSPGSLVRVGSELWYSTILPMATVGHISTMGIASQPIMAMGSPMMLASDGASIFYYDGAAIQVLTINNGKLNQFTAEPYVRSLAVDSSLNGYVYWIVRDAQSATGYIKRSPKASLMTEIVASNRTLPRQLVVDDELVYWIEDVDCVMTPSSILRWKVSDAPDIVKTISTTPTCGALTEDATHIYWTSGGAAYAKVKP